MSGQQWGSAIGGLVGAYFGGPAGAQWGMAIGGMIGGWIDPTVVNGPRIGEGQAQSAAEGLPIAWVMGTAGWLQGQIVQVSKRREVKKTDDGKGSGTEVNTYEAHQDFCILICESSTHRDSLMAGVLMVRLDGKVVYDMRPASAFSAENAKFLRNHTFYNGAETQLPDPTLEAITGVGNTPYYRGVFTMVARDVNLSQYGDRIPTYEFVMVGAGSEVSTTTTSYAGPIYGRFKNGAASPLVDSEAFYTFEGYRQLANGTEIFHTGATVAEVLAKFGTGYFRSPTTYLGWTAMPSGGIPTNAVAGLRINTTDTPADVSLAVSVQLVYSEYTPEQLFNIGADSTSCPIIPTPAVDGVWYQDWSGNLVNAYPATEAHPELYGYQSCTSPDRIIRGIRPVYIKATRRSAPEPQLMGDPCLLGVPVKLPDDPTRTINCAGVIAPAVTYVDTAGTYKALQAEATTTTIIGGVSFVEYSALTLAPILPAGDASDTQAYWEAAYNAAVTAGTIAAGLVYPTDYPQNLTTAYVGASTATALNEGSLTLAAAITRICARGGLTSAQLDTADLDHILAGYMVTQPYNGAECLRPLMTAKTCYGSEYDAQLHFHKHGETIGVTIDSEDLIEGSEETEQDTREQAIEYPRLLSVTAIDPTQDYTARPQVERRITPDVRAIGEESIQVPVVMSPDEQRQLASKGMKISWARQQGPVEFSVPYATASETYLKLVPGKPFAFRGKRYIAEEVRTEDGEIHIKGAYDRQSAYTSAVTATPAEPPNAPPSNIGGVTLFAAMNLPRLRSRDNSPGMYMAFAGLLTSWPGALLQMSVDDGATWTTAIASATQQSVLGYLTAGIDTSAASTLPVAVHGGELNTITAAAFADGANPCAVLSSGVAEIVQFQTAAEPTPGRYNLTGLGRARLGTAAAPHVLGDRFVQLDNVYFLPLDISLSGRVLRFRPVTFGTSPDLNAVYSVTFLPQFTGPEVIEAYTNELGETYTNELGSTYYKVIS